MSQQEEQPRPSLRLRKASDRPPDAPPPSPPAEPPAAAPAEPAGAAPEAGSRLRLSSIIKPGSAGSTPLTPPEPPSAPPEPPAAQALPPSPPPAFKLAPTPVPEPEALPEANPAPAVEEVAPPPAAAATPPPPPAAPAAPAPALPKRPADFPPPPALKREAAEEAPKPPSPRAVGLVLAGVVILVLGGIGYLLFLDPLGLFKDAEPPQAAAPAATPPAATAPAQTPAQPAPAPAATIAAPGPGLMEETPEFTMPPPAPLVAGEEIAPGVVRLPRDADPVSAAPAQRNYEPPAPKPNPAYTALVNNLNISGIRPNSSGGFLMIGTMLHRPGDIVDQQSRLEFVGLDGQVITFKDPAGALYTRRF